MTLRELVDAGGERLVEHVRLAERRAVVEPHARLDETGRLPAEIVRAGAAAFAARRDRSVWRPRAMPERVDYSRTVRARRWQDGHVFHRTRVRYSTKNDDRHPDAGHQCAAGTATD